jgi:hypothetical protein
LNIKQLLDIAAVKDEEFKNAKIPLNIAAIEDKEK